MRLSYMRQIIVFLLQPPQFQKLEIQNHLYSRAALLRLEFPLMLNKPAICAGKSFRQGGFGLPT